MGASGRTSNKAARVTHEFHIAPTAIAKDTLKVNKVQKNIDDTHISCKQVTVAGTTTSVMPVATTSIRVKMA